MNIKYHLFKRNNRIPIHTSDMCIKESYLENSNMNLKNVELYIKQRNNGDIKSFKENLSIIDKYMKVHKTKGLNILNNALCENLLYVEDTKFAKSLLEEFIDNHTIINNEFNKVLELCDIYTTCDRMVDNFNNLEETSNLSKILIENRNDIEDCLYETCLNIDKLNIDLGIKYNLALESLVYGNYKYNLDIPYEFIIENVTNYFLYSNDQIDKEEKINNILTETVIFNENEKKSFNKNTINDGVKNIIEQMKKCSINDKSTLKSLIYKMYTKSPENIIEETPNFLSFIRNAFVFSTLAAGPIGLIPIFIDKFIELDLKRKHTKEMLSKLESEKKKTETKIKSCKKEETREKYKQYLKTIEESIEKIDAYYDTLKTEKEMYGNDTLDENMLYINDRLITRKTFLELHHKHFIETIPVIINYMVDYINRKYKFLINGNAYRTVDSDVISKFKYANEDILKDYISLDGNKVYIDIAYILPRNLDPVISNGDMLEILDDICEYLNIKSSDNYCVFFEGDEDMYHIHLSSTLFIDKNDFCRKDEEKSILETMSLILAIDEEMKNINKSSKNAKDLINENILFYSNNKLNSLNEFNKLYGFIDSSDLNEIYSDNIKKVYREYTTSAKYIKSAALQESIYNLYKKDYKNKEFASYNRYNVLYELYCINEFLENLSNKDEESILETSFVNTVKIAREKFKKEIKTFSDKEKILSNKMDNMLDRFYDKVQKEMTSKNREAVIKGSIIPSFSSILKLTIASNVAWMINPVLAVITAVGGIAAVKHGTKRERQFILDEIDIQLKMVEKKMQLAESNNDMKSLEQLMKIEKGLNREKKRIMYRLRTSQYAVDKD